MAEDAVKPAIREHTLERIARFLGDHGSGPQIVEWLRSWGVPDALIEYPNTKWRMVYAVLRYYSYSADKADREMLYAIIAEMLHPLMFNGDKAVAQAAAADFNKFLEYDRVVATYSHDNKKYYVYKEDELGVEPEEASQLLNEELFQQECNELDVLLQPENREKISILRKSYQALIDVVTVFCENPSNPTAELNDAYVTCKDLVTKNVMELGLFNSKKIYRLATYSLPFITLYNAEKHFLRNGKVLSWDTIRPEMYATYGDIDDLYRRANGSDVLSKPDVQQTLNDVSLLLSKIKEEDRKRAEAIQKQKEENGKSKSQKIIDALDDAIISGLKNLSLRSNQPVRQTIQKIEITKMPELQMRSVNDVSISKGKKRVYPPKFSSTEWSKAGIRFLNERDVVITAGVKQVASDYEALGFADEKRDKPNSAWGFLLGLANNNGSTAQLPKPIPDSIKQHKKQLSDRLKTIFKNETDPFYDASSTSVYKIKINLIPPTPDTTPPDKLGTREYLEETMTEVYDE